MFSSIPSLMQRFSSSTPPRSSFSTLGVVPQTQQAPSPAPSSDFSAVSSVAAPPPPSMSKLDKLKHSISSFKSERAASQRPPPTPSASASAPPPTPSPSFAPPRPVPAVLSAVLASFSGPAPLLSRKAVRASDGKGVLGVFSPYNTNRGGQISYPEFKGCLRSMGARISDEEGEALARYVDEDGDGVIDVAELQAKLRMLPGEETTGSSSNNNNDDDGRSNAPAPALSASNFQEEKKSDSGDEYRHDGSSAGLSRPLAVRPSLRIRTSQPSPPRSGFAEEDGADDVEDFRRAATPRTAFVLEDEDDEMRRYNIDTERERHYDYGAGRRWQAGDGADNVVEDGYGIKPMGLWSGERRPTTTLTSDNEPPSRALPSSVAAAQPSSAVLSASSVLAARTGTRTTAGEYGLFSPVSLGGARACKFEHDPRAPPTPGTLGAETVRKLGDLYRLSVSDPNSARNVMREEDNMHMFQAENGGGMFEGDSARATPAGLPASRRLSPKELGKGKRGSFYEYSEWGTRDEVDELLRSGPQPDFAVTEKERKILRDRKLLERRLDSEHQKELEEANCREPSVFSRTFSSHLEGAGGAVKADPKDKDGSVQSEWQAVRSFLHHDYNNDECIEKVKPPKPPSDLKDERVNDLDRTERMILARLTACGSIPGLKHALRSSDLSKSGVVSKSEFAQTMARFGIQLEQPQLESIFNATKLVDCDSTPRSKRCLLDNYTSLNHQYMDYEVLLDKLDTSNVTYQHAKTPASALSVNGDCAKYFSSTGRAVIDAGKHLGRSVARKLVTNTNRLLRDNVEQILSNYDESKLGFLTASQLREGLKAVGSELSEKEFKALTDVVLRRARSGGGSSNSSGGRSFFPSDDTDTARYAVSDILPAADAYVAICEHEDFSAESERNTHTATGFVDQRHSTVIFPETPQASVLSEREKATRLRVANLAHIIGKNDARVKEAWEKGSGVASVENVKSALSEAGIQVSDLDATILSNSLGGDTAGRRMKFDEVFSQLKIKTNIAEVRVDSRTNKPFVGTEKAMKSSRGVVRVEEELPGGIFNQRPHSSRGSLGQLENNLYGDPALVKRTEQDASGNIILGNRRRRASPDMLHADNETSDLAQMYTTNTIDQMCLLGGNRKKSPTFDMSAARDHLEPGVFVSESKVLVKLGDGGAENRLSPDLVGNKKGRSNISEMSHVGSEPNPMIERIVRENSLTPYSPQSRYPQSNSDTFATIGSRYSDGGSFTPAATPRRAGKKMPDGSSTWTRSSMKDFISIAGCDRPVPLTPSHLPPSSDAAATSSSTPLNFSPASASEGNAGGDSAAAPKHMRFLKKKSQSLAALPSFGEGQAPWATIEDAARGNGENRRTPLRPGGDMSDSRAQNYYQNSVTTRRPAPFAVEGDRPSPYLPTHRPEEVVGRRGTYGLGGKHGFNIISNEPVAEGL